MNKILDFYNDLCHYPFLGLLMIPISILIICIPFVLVVEVLKYFGIL